MRTDIYKGTSGGLPQTAVYTNKSKNGQTFVMDFGAYNGAGGDPRIDDVHYNLVMNAGLHELGRWGAPWVLVKHPLL